MPGRLALQFLSSELRKHLELENREEALIFLVASLVNVECRGAVVSSYGGSYAAPSSFEKWC